MMIIQIRLEEELVEKIDQLRKYLTWCPSRSHAIRWIVNHGIDMLENEKKAELELLSTRRRATL